MVPGGGHPAQERWARDTCQGPAERSEQDCSSLPTAMGSTEGRHLGKTTAGSPRLAACPPPADTPRDRLSRHPVPQPGPGAAACNAGLTLRPSACSHPPQGRRALSSTSLRGNSSNADGQQAGRRLFCPCVALDGAERAALATQGYVYNRDSVLVSLAITASYYYAK